MDAAPKTTEEEPQEENSDKQSEEPQLTEEKPEGDVEKKEKKKREPEVVNSRAALLESAPDVKRDVRSTVGMHCNGVSFI